MQQRKAKVPAEGVTEQEASPAAVLPRSATARDLLEAEEAVHPCSVTPRKKSKKRPGPGAGERRCRPVVNLLLAAVVVAVPLAVVFLVHGVGVPAVWFAAARAQLRRGFSHASFPYARSAPDKLLGGLLAAGVDEKTCRSRHEASAYRRNTPRRPSPHLVAKLRRHEELQRRCGPGSDAYGRAIQQLSAGRSAVDAECKYVVSVCNRGLGNRILAAASAFLYALLTDRVLLIDRGNGMDELFCEPFPGATWLLPLDFPVTGLANITVDAAETYGNMLKNKVLTTDSTEPTQMPALAYVYLEHDYGDSDKRFFCDDDQQLMSSIQWLVARMDTYSVPGLFQVPSLAEELAALFPERDAVFHHLGRYLFHPADHVWGLVSRYYRAYLARAEQLVGVQVRVFESEQGKSPHVLQQITSCMWKEKLLPEVLSAGDPAVAPPPGAGSKTVLITSLTPWFYERIKSMYWEQPTASGEDVGVHQPSHEEYQQFGRKSHDTKAWAEMCLLSLCDVLVTSGWSTFGYVAQGLAGVTPWVMYRPFNFSETPDPPCARDVSMEPCFHTPPMYHCKLKETMDTARSLPHLQRCEDVQWGLKLVQDPK
ncbi:galactoside 2-alpha-L-fucosyltransferase-like [Hordeum vulgare subsp. vulgare]|uniref:Fucosyltransferase n=1 Tax=Hordeum vulgare subsp. vulgare TaxID=112509 RepID=A0A8I6Z3R4_HORVV|nr:galactoside 2-alpha-L-fucosyltransferase-like [Hordeum vulgare subsp. vulgare]